MWAQSRIVDSAEIGRLMLWSIKFKNLTSCEYMIQIQYLVPVMNGHSRDQAKVSVYCRWPLVTGTDGQAGDAKYNTPCNTYYILLSPPAIFLMNTRIVIITRRQHGNLRDLSVASLGARASDFGLK